MKNVIVIFLFIHLLLNLKVHAKWSVEAVGGDAYCFKTPLEIRQHGFRTIHLWAKYATHSFRQPIYYSLKVTTWKKTSGWELELIHLKIKLKNTPPEIQRFEVSHGYNLLMINRVLLLNSFLLRFGAGAVLAHPENEVRGKLLAQNNGIIRQGYYFVGPALQISISKLFHIYERFFLTIEGKLNGSYAKIPVDSGNAYVTNIGLHGLIGLRYEM